MDFTIVTPSFKQLDYLECCIASVADQGAGGSENVGMCESGKGALLRSVSAGSQSYAGLAEQLSVEHIVQDAGSPGIEEFAEKTAERLLGKYGGGRVTKLEVFELLHFRTPHGYSLRIFKEKDEGMYDAINKGMKKSHSELFAWLNSDEQYFLGTLQTVERSFDRDKSVDVVLGDVVLLNKDYHPAIYRRIMRPFSWHTRLVHLHSLSAATFFKRAALPNPAFEKRWKIIGDAVLVDHLVNAKRKFCCLKKPLSSYMITGENMSLTMPGAELPAWHREMGFPPRWVRPLVILLHRIRRLLAGAYQSQKVALKIYRFGSQERENVYGSTSYRWKL
jgi:glycosyltransferase involved in cell wall biosynthesis